MKRYLLFGGERHYAMGGMADVIYQSDNLSDIANNVILYRKEAFTLKNNRNCELNWFQVFDTQEGLIIAQSETQAYGSHLTISPFIKIDND